MTRSTTRALRWALFSAAMLLLATGCEVVTDVDRDASSSSGAGSSGAGSSGSGLGSGAGGNPSAGGACDPLLCPGTDVDCVFRVCDPTEGCAIAFAAQGSACDDGAEPSQQRCDGQGSCVECNSAEDCPEPAAQSCTDHRCQSATCTDGLDNGTETDVDCGGVCPGCQAGQMCEGPSDCLSDQCDGGVCAGAGGAGGGG